MRSKPFIIAALGLTALVACSDDDSTGLVEVGAVRVVSAISDVPTTDIVFGDAVVKAGLLYKGVYENASLTPGDLDVSVREGGTTTDLVSISQDVAAWTAYTVIAFGSEAEPQSLVLTDDRSAPAAGKAKLRIANAAASGGAVDVYAVKEADDLEEATAIATNVAVKTASDYVELAADSYIVILTEAGTKTPVLSVPGVALSSDKALTVVAVEKAGGGEPLEGITLVDR